MIALDARLSLSFTQGLLAAINPCGFVLLPTYLAYFLGMENLRPGAERASVSRALLVGLAVSGGFMSVFVVIGAITKWSTHWFLDRSAWISLAIGLALVVLGVAMLLGYRLPFTTPKLDIGKRDRTVTSMFVFGLTYAVASIGCTIGPFTGTVLGAVSTQGVGRGILAIGLYGLGMALLVTGLTVTLAFANTGLLRVLRSGMQWFEVVAGVFVLATGLYLSWYWFSSLRNKLDDPLINHADDWQSRLHNFVERNQHTVVIAAIVVIVGALAVSVAVHQRAKPEAA